MSIKDDALYKHKRQFIMVAATALARHPGYWCYLPDTKYVTEVNANVQPRIIFASSPVAGQQQKHENYSIRALLGQIQNLAVSHD